MSAQFLRVPALVVLLILLGGCANTPHWGAWSHSPTPSQLARAREQAPVSPRIPYQAGAYGLLP